MNPVLFRILAVVALLGCALPAVSLAQDPALKQRMAQRLPSIDDLKLKRIVGENNRGYLEMRGTPTPEAARIVEEENRDREAVYDLIARKSETTKEAVGRKRAEVIAANSAPGVLIQAANGVWAPK